MTTKIREGYKQTEVGVIPEDWGLNRLCELGKFTKGQGVKKDEALSGEIPCVRYGELYTRHNDYIKQFNSFISKEISETSKKLKPGDILFAGSGETKEEIRKCVAFIDDIEAYAGGDIVILTPFNIEPLYLGYLLNAPMIQKQKSRRGQGDAVVHISSTQLGNICVPLPPAKSEQTAIASALSDADALITSIEKLIEKKRAIKQGALQELLKQFEGCDYIELGDFCEFTQGIQIPISDLLKYKLNGFIRYLYIRDFFTDEYPCYVVDIYPNKIMNSQDLMMVNTGNTAGRVYSGSHGVLSNNAFKITFNDKIADRDYLYCLLRSTLIQNSIQELFNSSGQPHVGHKNIALVKIPLPPIEEQTRIATILSDMDAEITALEQKLGKYKMIKQGMMQELLTGKIRLI